MNSLSGQVSIQVGKKKYQCHLSMNAFRLMCEEKNISLGEMQELLQSRPLNAVPQVLYQGLYTHCHFHNKSTEGLPSYEYFAARILDNQDDLEKYTGYIAKVFNGEAIDDEEKPEEGNE